MIKKTARQVWEPQICVTIGTYPDQDGVRYSAGDGFFNMAVLYYILSLL